MLLNFPKQIVQFKQFRQFYDFDHLSTVLNSIQNSQIIQVKVINDLPESIVRHLLFEVYFKVIFAIVLATF